MVHKIIKIDILYLFIHYFKHLMQNGREQNVFSRKVFSWVALMWIESLFIKTSVLLVSLPHPKKV